MIDMLDSNIDALMNGDENDLIIEMQVKCLDLQLNETVKTIIVNRKNLISIVKSILDDDSLKSAVLKQYRANRSESEAILNGETSIISRPVLYNGTAVEEFIMSLTAFEKDSVEWRITMHRFVNAVGKIVFGIENNLNLRNSHAS